MDRESYLESRLEDKKAISSYMHQQGMCAYSLVCEAFYAFHSVREKRDLVRDAEKRMFEMLPFYARNIR